MGGWGGGAQLSLSLRQIARNKIIGPLVAVPVAPCAFLSQDLDLFSLFSRSLSFRRQAEGVILGRGEFLFPPSFWKSCPSHSPTSFFSGANCACVCHFSYVYETSVNFVMLILISLCLCLCRSVNQA